MRATDQPFNIDKKLVYEAHKVKFQWRIGRNGRADDRAVRDRLDPTAQRVWKNSISQDTRGIGPACPPRRQYTSEDGSGRHHC
jgi:hypothetical protein